MNIQASEKTIIRDLGDGLILRRSVPADADALRDFNATMHTENPAEPQVGVGAWTHDLLSRPHPTFQPDEFTIVEEQATGRIVSSLNLIPQTWEYDGIPFGVGRPELVGTLPEFRHRGLVRTQFEVIHQWSAERCDMLQAITGIPTYYRQFGYEMALELDGGRAGYEPQVPKLKEGDPEPYTLRPATEADIPFLMAVYDAEPRRSLMHCQRTEAIWRYEMSGQSEKNITRQITHIIEDASNGEAVGYIRHPASPWDMGLVATDFVLKEGISWLAVSPPVARFLWNHGEELKQAKEQKHTMAFGFWLGSNHPVYNVLRENLPRVRQPYGWYTRIPDLAGFICHIGPALEKRLASSIAVGHTGKLRISRASNMLTLSFEHGKLTGVEDEKRAPTDYGDLALPNLLIHQLIFGYRSYEELYNTFPDVYVDNDQARVLLEILFTKRYARVIPVA